MDSIVSISIGIKLARFLDLDPAVMISALFSGKENELVK